MANEKTELEERQDHIKNTLTDVVRIVGNIERTVIAGFKNQGDRINNIETEMSDIKTEMNNRFSKIDKDISVMKTDISVMKTDISETKSDIADLRYLIVKVLEKVSD